MEAKITVMDLDINFQGLAFLEFTGCIEQLTVILNLDKFEKKLGKKLSQENLGFFLESITKVSLWYAGIEDIFKLNTKYTFFNKEIGTVLIGRKLAPIQTVYYQDGYVYILINKRISYELINKRKERYELYEKMLLKEVSEQYLKNMII